MVSVILVCCCGSYDVTVLGCDAMSLDNRSAVLGIIILRTVTVLGCDAMSLDNRSAVLGTIILRTVHPE